MKKLMLAMMTVAAASVFGSFSYQGALKLADGTAVTELTKSIEFRLYADATGNNVLWAGQASVLLASGTGVFNTEISDSLQAPSDFQGTRQNLDDVLAANGTLYLGLTVVGSNGEIRPRQKLLAVPTASFAHNVKKATGDFTVEGATVCNSALTAKGNMTVSGTATIGGTATIADDVTVQKNVTVSGNVTVNGKIMRDTTEVVPVPVGGIIMWTQPSAPDGEWATGNNSGHWAICNGQDNINGLRIPDLRGRFVVGVNDTTTGQSDAWKRYAVGDKGGDEQVTLNASQIPPHTHTIARYLTDYTASFDTTGQNVYTPRADKSHGTGTFSTNTDGGEGQPHNNLPPYYALYYIMRVR